MPVHALKMSNKKSQKVLTAFAVLLLLLSLVPGTLTHAFAASGTEYNIGTEYASWLVSAADSAKEKTNGPCTIIFSNRGDTITYTLTGDGELTNDHDVEMLPSVDENDISIHLAWEINTPELTTNDTIVYQIPSNISWNLYGLQGEGGVYDLADEGQTEIGWYTISGDGKITVQYYDNFVTRDHKYTYISMTGSIYKRDYEDWDHVTFEFPGMGTIVQAPEPEDVIVPVYKSGVGGKGGDGDGGDSWTVCYNTGKDKVSSIVGLAIRDQMLHRGTDKVFDSAYVLDHLIEGSFRVYITDTENAGDGDPQAVNFNNDWELLDDETTAEIKSKYFTEEGYVIPHAFNGKSFIIFYRTDSYLRTGSNGEIDSYGKPKNIAWIGKNSAEGKYDRPASEKKVQEWFDLDRLDEYAKGSASDNYSIGDRIPFYISSSYDMSGLYEIGEEMEDSVIFNYSVTIEAAYFEYTNKYAANKNVFFAWSKDETYVDGSLEIKYNGRDAVAEQDNSLVPAQFGIDEENNPGKYYYILNNTEGVQGETNGSYNGSQIGGNYNLYVLLGGKKGETYTISFQTKRTHYDAGRKGWTKAVSYWWFAGSGQLKNYDPAVQAVFYRYGSDANKELIINRYEEAEPALAITKSALNAYDTIDPYDRELEWKVNITVPSNVLEKSASKKVTWSDDFSLGGMEYVEGSLKVSLNGEQMDRELYSDPRILYNGTEQTGFQVEFDLSGQSGDVVLTATFKTKALQLETTYEYGNDATAEMDGAVETAKATWKSRVPGIAKNAAFFPTNSTANYRALGVTKEGNILWQIRVSPLSSALALHTLKISDAFSGQDQRAYPSDTADFRVYQSASSAFLTSTAETDEITGALAYSGSGGKNFSLSLDATKLDRDKFTFILFETTPELTSQSRTYHNKVSLLYPDGDTQEETLLAEGETDRPVQRSYFNKAVYNENQNFKGLRAEQGNLMWVLTVMEMPEHVNGTTLYIDDDFAQAVSGNGGAGVSTIDDRKIAVYQALNTSGSLVGPISGALQFTKKDHNAGYSAELNYSVLDYRKVTYLVYETTPELFAGAKAYSNTAKLSYQDSTDSYKQKEIEGKNASTTVTRDWILQKHGVYNSAASYPVTPDNGNILWVISLDEMPYTWRNETLTWTDTFSGDQPMELVEDSFVVYQLERKKEFTAANASDNDIVHGAISVTPHGDKGSEGFTITVNMKALDRTKRTFIVYQTWPSYLNGEQLVDNTIEFPNYDKKAAAVQVVQDYLQKDHLYKELTAYIDYTVQINNTAIPLNRSGNTVTLRDRTGSAITIVESSISFNGTEGCSYTLEDGHNLTITIPDETPVLLTYTGYLYPGTLELEGGEDGNGTNYIVLEGEAYDYIIDSETSSVHRSYARGGGDVNSLYLKKVDSVTKEAIEGVQISVNKYILRDGVLEPVLDAESFTTNDIGETETFIVRNDYLYVLEEVQPPEGYALHGKWMYYREENIPLDADRITLSGEKLMLFSAEETEEYLKRLTIENDAIVNIKIRKQWDDGNNQDGKRPESIVVRLHADGEEIDSAEVTALDRWQTEFKNLPRYENGKEIIYTITEDRIEDYQHEIDAEKYIITNRYTPGKTNVEVEKVWKDDQNRDGIRPEEITVKLFADGEDTGLSGILNESNGWYYNFKDLDEFKDGGEITYVVREENVDGYETSVTGDMKRGFVVHNDHESKSEPEPLVTPTATSTSMVTMTPSVTPIPTEMRTANPTPTFLPTAVPVPTATPAATSPAYYFSFTKVWSGNAAEDISFKLYNSSGTVRRVYNESNRSSFRRTKINESEWLYEAWLSFQGGYVIEEAISGCTILYKNTGDHALETDRVYNGGTITNYEVPKTGDGSNPAACIIILCVSGLGVIVCFLLRRRKYYNRAN